MSQSSTNLSLPYLAPGQAQKHVTVNESLLLLDALVQLSPVSASLASQPATPEDGACYILPPGKTGPDWGGMAEQALAYYRDGAWQAIWPRAGWTASVRDSGAWLRFDGATWVRPAAGQAIGVSQGDRIIGRPATGAGPAEEIACTQAGRNLIAAGDAGQQRSVLGAAGLGDANTYAQAQTAPIFQSLAQIGGVVWAGDIDGAKWTAKLGGYMLGFASDFDSAGFETFPLHGRTYAVKVRLTNDGFVDAHSGFRVRGAQIADADGRLQLRSVALAALPAATPAGTMVYVPDGASGRRLAVSDGSVWRWPDGQVVS